MINHRNQLLRFGRSCFLFFALITAWVSAPSSSSATDFAHEIVPILKTHCAECHAGTEAKGGFSINTRALFLEGGAAEPGNAADSYFLELIEEKDPDYQMPPEGKARVSAEQVALLKKWVDEGMPWEAGFTFGERAWEPPLKPRRVELPPPTNGREHPIDRILDADLAEQGQPLPESIDDAQFLRRASLDTNGLLPTPDQLHSFLANDDPNKRNQLIDELLANDIAYADHWLTTWNDLLRNDYTGTGFITNGRTQITTWLYDSLRDNKPYDQFVRELLAPPTADSAGFINGIKWRGEVNSSQTVEIQFAQNISQVFLGINMKCASCHDSFIDSWTLDDAYSLAAVFADQPLEINRCDKPTGRMATPRWIFPELGEIDADLSKEQRLQQLAELMTHPDNGRFARTLVNRVWHRLMGRGIVHPVDAMGTEPCNEDLLDYLAVRFVEDGYDLRKLIRFIMTSEAYQSRSRILPNALEDKAAYAGPISKRMTAEQFIDSIWQITQTNPPQADAKVNRVLDSARNTSNLPTFKGFESKAQWIWHEGEVGKKSQLRRTISLSSAPKTAILVATCDNAFVMKLNGEEVANSNDWTKPVQIDVTDAFQAGENLLEVDAEMFGGSAGFVFQLMIVDETDEALTFVSDQSWEAKAPEGKWAAAKELHPYGKGPWGSVFDSKSALTNWGASPPIRAALVQNDFLMRSLGRPNRDQVVTTRPADLTTLQAIDLANGETLANYLQQGATNASHNEEIGDWLFQFALSRSPTDQEHEVIQEVLGDAPDQQSIEDLMWLVFMLPEFQMIR